MSKKKRYNVVPISTIESFVQGHDEGLQAGQKEGLRNSFKGQGNRAKTYQRQAPSYSGVSQRQEDARQIDDAPQNKLLSAELGKAVKTKPQIKPKTQQSPPQEKEPESFAELLAQYPDAAPE